MINLKLAQCDNKGKFEKYLELGGDYGNFSYFKSCFIKWHNNFVDKKDPLNRLNGLLDGRTYGNGQFILLLENEELEIVDGEIKKIKTLKERDKEKEFLKSPPPPPAIPPIQDIKGF